MKITYEVSLSPIGCYCDEIEVDENATDEEIKEQIRNGIKLEIDIYR